MTTLTYVAMHGGQPTHTSVSLEVVQRESLRAQKQSFNGSEYDYLWVDQQPFVTKPGEWRLIRKPKGSRVVPAESTGRTIVAVAYAPAEQQTVVDGPYPVKARATTAGAELDVSAFLFQAVFTELITKADDDPEALAAELADMADLLRSAVHQGRNSAARHEFDEAMQRMLKEFAADGVIPVYGPAVGRLAERLAEIAAPRPVPGQREAGAA